MSLSSANEPVNYAIRTAIEYGVLQMLYEGKDLGLWEWVEPVIADDKDINIPQDNDNSKVHNELNNAKHPISEKQGE